MQNSFTQRIFIVLFFACCAAGLVQFYRHMVWKANDEINNDEYIRKLYDHTRR